MKKKFYFSKLSFQLLRLACNMKNLTLSLLLLISYTVHAQKYLDYYTKGAEYAKADKNEEALKEFDKSIALYDNYFLSYYNRGYVKYKLQDYKGALSDFNSSLHINPKFTTALYWRAQTFNTLEQYELCIADLDKVLVLTSANYDIYALRGNANYKLKDYASALKDFDKAIFFASDRPEAYYVRAYCHFNLNHMAEAAADIEKYLDSKQDLVDALEIAIRTNMAIGKMDKALIWADQFSKRKGMKAVAYNYMGVIHFTQNKFKEAVADYSEAMKAGKTDGEIYYSRGASYAALNEKNKACEDFQKCLSLGYNAGKKDIEKYCKP